MKWWKLLYPLQFKVKQLQSNITCIQITKFVAETVNNATHSRCVYSRYNDPVVVFDEHRRHKCFIHQLFSKYNARTH